MTILAAHVGARTHAWRCSETVAGAPPYVLSGSVDARAPAA